MSYFKNFIRDNNIEKFSVGGISLFSYIDANGQEWLINRVNTEYKLPNRRNQLCEFTATNGQGIVDTPIKGNIKDEQFIASFYDGVEVLKWGSRL